ncbi:MAG: nucleoside kinase [Clostridia bacterium]|nr:nucleoside kinase [Clostridia bacterium]
MPDICKDLLLRECEADLSACVRAAEEEYREKIEEIAARLVEGRRRVVMLAGPSSSGKTTTAAILADRLTVLGHPTAILSLDNFYRLPNDPAYPRQENGDLDFEAVDALETDLVHDCLAAILRGEEYMAPVFDFMRGTRATEKERIFVPEGGFLIVEGLHALNPRLTEGLPADGLFLLFISVSTNITDAAGNRLLSGRKIRFLRRMSRDHLYRNSSAARTYELWRNVLAGEDRYLYPYKGRADMAINTFHRYEIGVLRPFAERLLAAPDAPRDAYIETVRGGISHFPPLPDTVVPEDSLLREFIPGGIYET